MTHKLKAHTHALSSKGFLRNDQDQAHKEFQDSKNTEPYTVDESTYQQNSISHLPNSLGIPLRPHAGLPFLSYQFLHQFSLPQTRPIKPNRWHELLMICPALKQDAHDG